MSIREIRITPDWHASPPIPSDLPEVVFELAKCFPQLASDSIRFIFQGPEWRIFEFQNFSFENPPTTVVRFEQIDAPFSITARELDVLSLVALGLSNQGIAQRLGTSARTVSTQVETLLQKLNQESRTALAALAIEHGYIRLPLPGGTYPDLTVPAHVQLQNVAFGDAEKRQTATADNVLKSKPVTIGVVIPAMQSESDGTEFLKGAQLAAEEVNHIMENGRGRRIQLQPVFADLFDSSSVRTAFTSLLDKDIDALISSYVATEDPSVLEPVADARVPFLHTATQYSQLERVKLDPERYGSFFQTCPPEIFYGREFVDVLRKLSASGTWVPSNRKFVSIDLDTATTGITNDDLVDYAMLHGWSLAHHVRVPTAGVDWSQVIAKVQQEEPSVILLTHFLPDELIEFYHHFLTSESNALIMSVYGPSIMQFQETFGALADGIIWSTTSGTYSDVLGTRFRSAFTDRYGSAPGWSQAGAAYDQVNLLIRAWQSAGTTDPQFTSESLRNLAHRGVNGAYFLGAEGQTNLGYPYSTLDPSLGQAHMIYQIREGTNHPIGPPPYGDIENFRLPSWVRSTVIDVSEEC